VGIWGVVKQVHSHHMATVVVVSFFSLHVYCVREGCGVSCSCVLPFAYVNVSTSHEGRGLEIIIIVCFVAILFVPVSVLSGSLSLLPIY
jgi:hypothetical protein